MRELMLSQEEVLDHVNDSAKKLRECTIIGASGPLGDAHAKLMLVAKSHAAIQARLDRFMKMADEAGKILERRKT